MPKKDEVTGEWRKLHNAELNDQYYNSRRRRDACLYLYGTEDNAVDQDAVRRLRDTRSSSPDEVCSDCLLSR